MALFEPCQLAEIGYADDLALLADCYDMLRRLTQEFQSHVSSWGLILSVDQRRRCALNNHNSLLSQSWSMTDLTLFSSCRLLAIWALTRRLCCQYHQQYQQCSQSFLGIRPDCLVCEGVVAVHEGACFRANEINTLLYGCETRTITFQTRRELRGFIMMCLRVIYRVIRWQQQLQHLRNEV